MLPHYNFQFPDMTAKLSIYLPKFHKLIPIPISLHKTERRWSQIPGNTK
jgi:hypothetical protein